MGPCHGPGTGSTPVTRSMRIGIISDTHDHIANTERAILLLREKGIELLCHLGDWVAPFTVESIVRSIRKYDIPLKGVLGNNDGEVFDIVRTNPQKWEIELAHHTLSFVVDKKTVVLYHGTDEIITDALVHSGKYDVVCTGHTHVPGSVHIGSTILVNPGTLSGFSPPRGGKIDVGECAVYDAKTHTVDLLNFPL